METCIECFSTDVSELESDPVCEGCSVMECGECDAQFERAEMNGIDHEDGCEATR